MHAVLQDLQSRRGGQQKERKGPSGLLHHSSVITHPNVQSGRSIGCAVMDQAQSSGTCIARVRDWRHRDALLPLGTSGPDDLAGQTVKRGEQPPAQRMRLVAVESDECRFDIPYGGMITPVFRPSRAGSRTGFPERRWLLGVVQRVWTTTRRQRQVSWLSLPAYCWPPNRRVCLYWNSELPLQL